MNTYIIKQFTRKIITNLIVGIEGISVIIAILVLLYIKKNNAIEANFKWLSLETREISFSFMADAFTGLFICLITGITFLVMVYSVAYLNSDPFLTKFLAILGLFCLSMLWLCIANNTVTLFIGWESVGLSSFLLISFWASRNEANVAALKAVFLNRVGDVFFLFAVLLVLLELAMSELGIANFLIRENKFIGIFFCLAACAKSAQLVLHTWLPDAMEGPTPVSSLLHSATMVTAGVFLIIKIYIFLFSEIAYYFAIIGLGTAIIAALLGVYQYDFKKIIAYSTCSQLGLLYLTATLGTLFAASYHLVTHAFFKCLLFLCSGVIIHSTANNEQDLRKMGLFSKILPVIYLIFSIGTLSLIGFIFMSGYYSKEFLLETLFFSGAFGIFLFIFSSFGVFFSAFYSGRLLYLTFIKAHISFPKNSLFLEGNTIMYISLFILTFFSIFAGKLLFASFTNYFWNDTLQLNYYIPLLEYELFSSFFILMLPMLLSFIGFTFGLCFFASLQYNNLSLYSLPFFYFIYSSMILKSYFDLLYSYFISRPIFSLGFIKYFSLDRGFFEISHYFFTKLKNNYLRLNVSMIQLFVIILLPIFIIVLNYVERENNQINLLNTLEQDNLIIIDDVFLVLGFFSAIFAKNRSGFVLFFKKMRRLIKIPQRYAKPLDVLTLKDIFLMIFSRLIRAGLIFFVIQKATTGATEQESFINHIYYCIPVMLLSISLILILIWLNSSKNKVFLFLCSLVFVLSLIIFKWRWMMFIVSFFVSTLVGFFWITALFPTPGTQKIYFKVIRFLKKVNLLLFFVEVYNLFFIALPEKLFICFTEILMLMSIYYCWFTYELFRYSLLGTTFNVFEMSILALGSIFFLFVIYIRLLLNLALLCAPLYFIVGEDNPPSQPTQTPAPLHHEPAPKKSYNFLSIHKTTKNYHYNNIPPNSGNPRAFFFKMAGLGVGIALLAVGGNQLMESRKQTALMTRQLDEACRQADEACRQADQWDVDRGVRTIDEYKKKWGEKEK